MKSTENTNRKNVSKRVFSWISRILIVIYNVAILGFVWIKFYYLYAFQKNRNIGVVVSIAVFALIYDKLARLYRAYKVGQYPVGETFFSQLLAFGIADIVLYVECCLIANRYVSLLPGIMAVMIQCVGTILWATLAKRFYMNYVKVPDTLIIYGSRDVYDFEKKLLKKYNHLFHIVEHISSEDSIEALLNAINRCETILLYEVGYGRRTALMTYCINEKKTFYITPRISDIVIEGFKNRHMIDTPLLKYEYQNRSTNGLFAKRLMDILLSLLGLIFFSPIMLLTAMAIKMEDGGKIFFQQERYTKDWKKFKICKFRSMIMEAEREGALLCRQNDERITKVGKIIRRFRIDELPQLFNVLKGDMSIVGPRPERVENFEEYVRQIPEFAYRLRVKGGLTGYAQIYGKYNTSAYDKLKLDLMYIENQGLFMDLRIIMLTLKMVFLPDSTEGFTEDKIKEMKRNTL